jgi:hypothetical protein
MVTTDAAGNVPGIEDRIALGIAEGDQEAYDRKADVDALTERLRQIRERLGSRLDGLPDDTTRLAHLEQLSGQMLHTLVVSEPWDTDRVGGGG